MWSQDLDLEEYGAKHVILVARKLFQGTAPDATHLGSKRQITLR